jgi:tetratricopeptide (TPR) repeat protein
MLRIVLVLLHLSIFFAVNVKAQDKPAERYLDVRGTSELEMEPLSRATANLYEGSNKVKSIQTGADGSFSFRLDVNKQYIIEVEKDGLISKRISFNTQMPDEEKGVWMNEFSMGLLKSCNGVDYSVLNDPVDRVSFDPKRREFISDKDYVTKMRPRIEGLLMRNDQCMLTTYESQVKKGDQLAARKNYQEAVVAYQEALKIYPSEGYPAKQISEINTQINKQQYSAEAYQKTIAEADALSSQQKYTEALQKYKMAATINPQETYPRQKVAEIESSLSQEQVTKQALLNTEDRYNQAMAKASVAYTRKDYATARQYYQEALEIKPSESLPKTRVQEIETIQAKKTADDVARASEIAKKAAFENDYRGLVATADEQYKARKYEEAKASYAKALAMKPSEAYPAQRVKAIDNAASAAQAAMQKNNDDSYNEAIDAGNKALARNQYPLAKESFQKALSLKPEDLTAKSMLIEVDRLAEGFAKRKSLDDQFSKVILTADGYLANKEFTKAKDSYLLALTLKPGDQYAQSKITAIDNTVATEQATLLKTQNDKYNAAISAGNSAIAQYQFALAKESFQKALLLKPDDQFAKNRIDETDRLAGEYAKRKALDDQYNIIIQTADGYLVNKELSKARASYQQALSLKPGDQYAQTKIATIDNSIAADQAAKLKVSEDGYKDAIGAANTAITQKTYTQAKEYLKKALVIKPGDLYATGRLAEVDRLIVDQQKKLEQEQLLTKQYNETIIAADKSYNVRDYANAKSSFSRALQIKPGDTYASQKIQSIDNILATELADKERQLDESYTTAMDRGTSAMVSKDYKSARDAFQQALAVKPSDASAKLKLSNAELLLSQEQDKIVAGQARKRKYDETVKAADQYLAQKNYAYAKVSYEQALDIMPGEAYPKQKLEESVKAIAEQERLLADQKAKESTYNLALASADKYFRAKEYSQARDEYSRALSIKPNEVFPKNKLAEMENLIRVRQKEQDEAKAKADAYATAINAGNAAFNGKNYPTARNSYIEALKYIPGDLLATDQIKKIDYLIAETEKVNKAEMEKKAAYETLIASADKLYDAGSYPAAKVDYKKALVLEPNSAYAKQRIMRIDEISRALSKTSAKTNTQSSVSTQKVVAAIPMGELNFKNESERQKYLAELMNKYPAGITLEKYKEQYKETYRYIIIRDNQALEFRRTEFTTYSGAQYSMNGKPITQQYFLSQVKTRQGESFKEIDMQ